MRAEHSNSPHLWVDYDPPEPDRTAGDVQPMPHIVTYSADGSIDDAYGPPDPSHRPNRINEWTTDPTDELWEALKPPSRTPHQHNV